MKQVLAQYQCLICGCRWQCKPAVVTCPECYHLYVKWVNFDRDFQKKRIKK